MNMGIIGHFGVFVSFTGGIIQKGIATLHFYCAFFLQANHFIYLAMGWGVCALFFVEQLFEAFCVVVCIDFFDGG